MIAEALEGASHYLCHRDYFDNNMGKPSSQPTNAVALSVTVRDIV